MLNEMEYFFFLSWFFFLLVLLDSQLRSLNKWTDIWKFTANKLLVISAIVWFAQRKTATRTRQKKNENDTQNMYESFTMRNSQSFGEGTHKKKLYTKCALCNGITLTLSDRKFLATQAIRTFVVISFVCACPFLRLFHIFFYIFCVNTHSSCTNYYSQWDKDSCFIYVCVREMK